MTIPDSGWSRDQLMGKSVSFKGIAPDGDTTAPMQKAAHGASKDKIDPMLWGRPGHLSEQEADVFVSGAVGLVPLKCSRVYCACC
jgi:hypothetical protein